MIDDRFRDGVWYNFHNGDFTTIDYDETASEVVFCDEDGVELDRVPEADFDSGDYHRVPEDVVENPADFFEEVTSYLHDKATDPQSIGSIPVDDEVGYRYAKANVTIVGDE